MVSWMRMWWWIGVAIIGTLAFLLDGTIGQSFAHKAKASRLSTRVEKKNESRATGRKRPAVAVVKKISLAKKDNPRLTRSKRANREDGRRVSALRGFGSRKQRALVRSRVTRHHPVRGRRRPALVMREAVQLPEPELARDFQSMLLADTETRQVLLAENIDKQWPTASLAKMMVGLLAMEDLEQERTSLQTPVVISVRASHAHGRTINLRPGEVFPLGELLQAMLVTSANDASIAVAEHIRGSVEACVAAMNRKARTLGMENTRYQTVNGMPLPGGGAGDVSSARDLAVLGMALSRYQSVLRWTSLDQVPFRYGTIMLPNTNHLVGRVYGVNGLKTGFTVRARYNLVATAQRGEKSLIVVVLGGRNSRVRFDAAEEFLEWGFSHDRRRTDVNESEEGKEHDDEFQVNPASLSH